MLLVSGSMHKHNNNKIITSFLLLFSPVDWKGLKPILYICHLFYLMWKIVFYNDDDNMKSFWNATIVAHLLLDNSVIFYSPVR